MNPVDKRRVRRAFSRAADRYEEHDAVQARVRARVLASLPADARRVLDVGAGTGALLARLAGRPGVRLAAVDLAPGMCAMARRAVPGAAVAAGDAEALPFGPGAFDLVVSSSALQWLPRLDGALLEIARVLAPGGAASIALFGERTLHELRAAWDAAGGPRRTHRFASRSDLATALDRSGLSGVVTEEELVPRYPDARSVLRSLKAIGAQGASPGTGGLAGRSATHELLRRYDALRDAEGVPATFHVLHAVAKKP
ncbi:MAG: methyltransferase domain-containing protein [Anaeromyxobacteraceae bacterium]